MASERDTDPHGANWLLLLLLVFGGIYLYSRQSAFASFPGSGGCGGCITPGPGGTATSTAPATGTGAYTGTAGAVCNMGAVFPMNLSANGAAFIKGNEGLTLTAVPDAMGHEIGYGHSIQPADNIAPGQTISQAQADALFAADSAQVVNCINGAVKVPLTQNQFDALADFVYNVGCTAFQRSTLLSKLNQCDYAGAQAQFSQWVHSGGQVVVGLVARRQADANLFGASGPAPQTITGTAHTVTGTGTATS